MKLSDFFISSLDEMNIVATYPLLNFDREVSGFTLAGINLSFFQRWLDKIDDPSISISIIDFNGVLLARNPINEKIGTSLKSP